MTQWLWLCRIRHRWVPAFTTAVWNYFECSRCGKRTAHRHQATGHQPVNTDWIARRVRKVSPPPRNPEQ